MTRFILLAQPRVGSTLLRNSLNKHPDIFLHGEVLNHGWSHSLPPGQPRVLAALRTVPGKLAVGATLHCFQPDRSWRDWHTWEPAWSGVAMDRDIRVVVLRRRDTLAQLCSDKIARELHNWGDQRRHGERPTVRIDPEELRWYREATRLHYAHRLAQIGERETLTVWYEDLCDRWSETVAGVQEFLGVPHVELKQATVKNETRPLSEVIENWDEVKGVR